MFNATFGDDQQRSFGDYLELAMQFQPSTTNTIYESLGLCHCFLFSSLVEYYFPREGSKYTHTHNTHTTHTHIVLAVSLQYWNLQQENHKHHTLYLYFFTAV